MSHLPFLKLFVNDWREEPTLRLCSRAARSLWLDMLLLMHRAQPRGELRLNGEPLDGRSLARVLGDRQSDVARWIGELERAGVFSRSAQGVIFCRRMVRDAARAELGAESAQRRWGARTQGDDRSVGANGASPAGAPIGSKVPSATAQTPESQTPESMIHDSKSHEGEEGGEEDAALAALELTPAEPAAPVFALKPVAGGAKRVVAAEGRPPPRKRQERADQHLVDHLSGQGMDAQAAWLLVMAARDPANPEHEAAAQRCEEHSRRHRLGWFAQGGSA